MLYYLDSSVAIRAIDDVPERERVNTWIDDRAKSGDMFVSSRILRTEIVRFLRRESRSITDADPILGRMLLVSLTDGIAGAAESIVPHVKTLDALHLGTALAIGEPLTIATQDERMKQTAIEIGFKVVDPVVG